ncbi:putative membrane protein [Streptoalloteichus tenebrarius]|uniref:Membrane protein n=1 Tax=Streptoalloteichus tenebrarius (strain ATCC 17920 / DSM 40477 / JCM 4838 / CBS 697.72 / NBRC 16177 / NCIMB 11028 / NRRL B-12390 / A12253. 1 / ISP 5477) TaxID=1933 RepID=A0ABT1I2L1_STRSD|nr:hypothetical protein [Streptoalloteichus tenebrarius]MCP2262023.1 putative membrane protein [Streptoalloteichus tenebrarius]BFF02145.1 hypothetical protein GCM10020241_38200 [Streptoalloteichus tenebrarius]
MVTATALALAFFLAVVGVAHFLAPGYFRTLVPSWLPAPGLLVAASGVAEIVTAGLLACPSSRAWGGWAAVALITSYLVSHLDALRHAHPSRPRLLDRPAGVAARLVVNLGYLAWAIAVALTATS